MSQAPALRFPGAYVQSQGDKPALIMAETGERMSYAELDAYANRLARFYRSIGLKPGDHVAYATENRLECTAIQWGAHYAGLYYTFVSTRLTPAEAQYIVSDCDAKVLVVTGETAPDLVDSLRSLAHPPRLYSLDPSPTLPLLGDAMAGFDPAPIPDAIEGSEMLYSSGTTGRPKGIKPAPTGLPLGSTMMVADFMKLGFGVNEQTVYLSPAPYYHTAPMKWVQGTTALGGTAVLMKKFDAEGLLQTIGRYKVTHSQCVPTMYHRLLSLPAEVRERHDLSSHRCAIHAAAPCPVPIKQAMIEWWGPIVSEYYGSTEGVGMTVTNSQAWLERPGTVGRAVFGAIHIVDDEGQEVPVGQEGLVYFSGGRTISYHKDPAKTAEAYLPNGWVTVGDIGKLDADGYLYLTDRKSNMIISGGVNVYPQETENVLITHPSVFDVAVIGTPHEDFGEEVRAVVQLKPGITPGPELAKELIAFCRGQLSGIKTPRVVDFRDELPREPNGKLLKRLLRDEYRARLAPKSN